MEHTQPRRCVGKRCVSIAVATAATIAAMAILALAFPPSLLADDRGVPLDVDHRGAATIQRLAATQPATSQPSKHPATSQPATEPSASAQRAAATQPASSTQPVVAGLAIRRLEDPLGLHQMYQVHGRLYSGGEPHGEDAFRSLAKLGVTTIVSVDGAIPQADLARKHGIRYVHVPIGYDAVDPPARLALARVARDISGVVYIHCHHGKHRGPAAAAVLVQLQGVCGPEQAQTVLETIGTGKNYTGLWRDVREFIAVPQSAVLPELHEVAPLGTMVAEMARIDRIFDRLKLLAANRFEPLADHPDVSPMQESLLLVEALRELHRLQSDPYGPEFVRLMAEGRDHAQALHDHLRQRNEAAAHEALRLVRANCTACHQQFRDTSD